MCCFFFTALKDYTYFFCLFSLSYSPSFISPYSFCTKLKSQAVEAKHTNQKRKKKTEAYEKDYFGSVEKASKKYEKKSDDDDNTERRRKRQEGRNEKNIFFLKEQQ